MVRHAATESSGRTAHAVDTSVPEAAIVSSPEARFTPQAAFSPGPEHTFRTPKHLALSFGFILVRYGRRVKRGLQSADCEPWRNRVLHGFSTFFQEVV
jgi:hypothetical protein